MTYFQAPEFGNGLLSNIANPTLNETNNYVILIEKERPQGKKREDSFDLREMQQIIRELTVGIVVFDQLPGVCLRPKYDQGTFVDIPPAYIDTHVAQCMIELDYYMKCLWHGSHFGRERRQKFTERWTEIMNVNKVSSGQNVLKIILIILIGILCINHYVANIVAFRVSTFNSTILYEIFIT